MIVAHVSVACEQAAKISDIVTEEVCPRSLSDRFRHFIPVSRHSAIHPGSTLRAA